MVGVGKGREHPSRGSGLTDLRRFFFNKTLKKRPDNDTKKGQKICKDYPKNGKFFFSLFCLSGKRLAIPLSILQTKRIKVPTVYIRVQVLYRVGR